MLRVQTIPRVKAIRDTVEEMKQTDFETNFKGAQSITKFSTNMLLFRKYIFSVVYVNDKICMAAFRDLLDMKILVDVLCLNLNLMRISDRRYAAMMWFGRKVKARNAKDKPNAETEVCETQSVSASRSSVAFNNFIKIIDQQEKSQDPAQSIDNRSQFSDFSLKLNQLRRMSEDYFDF